MVDRTLVPTWYGESWDLLLSQGAFPKVGLRSARSCKGPQTQNPYAYCERHEGVSAPRIESL